MSFQAYLDAIEDRTGLTPRALVDRATEKGFDDPSVKAATIVQWLADDYGLGRGHAQALVHVIKKGPRISTKHVGTSGAHRDDSDVLWLDGKAARPR
ncbi:uncharacterized protein DUF4287 [Murinocardiopsis flavida]|uniref:Uncharacterized protein DUF4287 n=1 Tax=Murinocardiopsis flavida TaxID=645275 RepID=A0A2P8D916_9ACTN|nr:DUF4287 domain-containing protein [Murinocardiopsis flavida]PSK93726.1 uncharacterized protein DUF4287 [Murinocardiopsis flavida]